MYTELDITIEDIYHVLKAMKREAKEELVEIDPEDELTRDDRQFWSARIETIDDIREAIDGLFE